MEDAAFMVMFIDITGPASRQFSTHPVFFPWPGRYMDMAFATLGEEIRGHSEAEKTRLIKSQLGHMRFMIRFQHWVMAMAVMLVIFLVSAFLAILSHTVTRISEDNAAAQFSRIADQAAGHIAALLPKPGERATAPDAALGQRSFQAFLSGLSLPPNGAIAVQDRDGTLLAFHGRGGRQGGLTPAARAEIDQLSSAALREPQAAPPGERSDFQILPQGADNEKIALKHRVAPASGEPLHVLIWAPLSDFTNTYQVVQRHVLVLSFLTLLVVLPLAFLGSRKIARTLAGMAVDSERLKTLDFSHQPVKSNSFLYEINALGDAQRVMHEAIHKRTDDLRKSQEKLERLVDYGIRLSREQDRTALLRHILFGARDIAHCAAATLFLKSENQTLEFVLRTNDDPLPASGIPLYNEAGEPNDKFIVAYSALHNQSVIIDDVYSETRFDLTGTKRFSEASGFRTVSILTVPLNPREGDVIGVIQLLNALDPVTGEVIPFPPDLLGFIEALAAQSAVALENQTLIAAQKDMMESLIKLIAGSIDAKSPYTGGHCERVPELGMMLAEAASNATEGPLADFRFTTDDEWREFRIGAWLHDCGKVTTPEHVVDKATKLEIIYNRIHEIRMRFEVLLRDARIDQLESLAAGQAPDAAQARFEARKAQLLDDFAFIAECNLGGEFMAPDRIERLQRIAGETWLRHFSERLGLAEDELNRYPTEPEVLPVTEHLLANKPQHVIPRTQWDVSDPKWGFKVKVPPSLYDYGELYNLAIGRGTLTEEERFKVNEHVMHSLMMLEQLPLPKNLRRVPEYAGTHHETLLGTGYPRKLADKELTVPMRIMAIADIFEALTASDRPYKKAKSLSESIRILHSFKQKQHIDPVIFDLFLTSGIYKRYADKFMLPEQIDEAEIQQYLG